MPFSSTRLPRPAMYNTPAIRNGGLGALQVEAIANRPQSIARRHMAASQLRMRDIEPDELSSSEWVRFLVMEVAERQRWMTVFTRHRRNSDESTASGSSSRHMDRQQAYDKAEEARLEAEDERREQEAAASASAMMMPPPVGSTPAVSVWARQFDGESSAASVGPQHYDAEYAVEGQYSARRPMHARRAVMEDIVEAPPPAYSDVRTRARSPPPAYEARSPGSPSC